MLTCGIVLWVIMNIVILLRYISKQAIKSEVYGILFFVWPCFQNYLKSYSHYKIVLENVIEFSLPLGTPAWMKTHVKGNTHWHRPDVAVLE